MNVWRKGGDGRYHSQGSSYSSQIHPHTYWLLTQAVRIIEDASRGWLNDRDTEILEDMRFTLISLNPRNGKKKEG